MHFLITFIAATKMLIYMFRMVILKEASMTLLHHKLAKQVILKLKMTNWIQW